MHLDTARIISLDFRGSVINTRSGNSLNQMLEEKPTLDWKLFTPAPQSHETAQEEFLVSLHNFSHEDHRETAKKLPGYTPQYAYLYRVRLFQLSIPLHKLRGLPDTVELSKMKLNEKCSVIGLLFKLMKSRKSYVKAIEEGETLHEHATFDEVQPLDDDEFYIENASGKRMLNLEGAELVLEGGKRVKASVNSLLSGTVGLLVCSLLSENEIQVYEVHLPGVMPLPPKLRAQIPKEDNPGMERLFERLEQGHKPRLACLVSGLDMDPEHSEGLGAAFLFRDFLLGRLASADTSRLLNCIGGVVVLGGLIKADLKLNKQLFRCYEFKEKQQAHLEHINKALKTADELLSALASKFQVIVLPGPGDASDSFLPQRALPGFCLPRTKQTGRLAMVSNPGHFELADRLVAAVDGSNMQTLLGLSKDLTSELDVLEQTLSARHFAPNCPESCAAFPVQKEDTLVMTHPCVLYVCGGATKTSSRVVHSASHAVKLLAVPRFAQEKEAVLLDLDTLESYSLGF